VPLEDTASKLAVAPEYGTQGSRISTDTLPGAGDTVFRKQNTAHWRHEVCPGTT